jgi:hypothetical protein
MATIRLILEAVIPASKSSKFPLLSCGQNESSEFIALIGCVEHSGYVGLSRLRRHRRHRLLLLLLLLLKVIMRLNHLGPAAISITATI